MRREILDTARSTGFEGSILDLYQMANQGANVPALLQAEAQAKQENMLVAQTPQEQQVGLREQQAMGNTDASMVFPDVPANTSFNTEGMRVPINITKVDEQGHLVQSYENVPPGIKDLPTGPKRGTVIETPAYQDGGMRGMIKAKIAMENQFGNNPAIARMIKPTINPYDFGDGDTGTHYLGSYGKFAIPSIQDVDGTLQYTGPSRMDEAIKFERVDDATYFAENYKDIAPALRERKKGGFKQEDPFKKGKGKLKKGNYNMARALELGYEPDASGHYPSVDYKTGMLLKSKNHPTMIKEFISQMYNPNIKLIANPSGYFGADQLQYVPRKKKGGYRSKYGKDPVTGTGKKPKGSGRRLYTDENPKDTVGIKFATPADARATVAKVKKVSKPYARKIQILTVGEQRAKVMGKTQVSSIFTRGKEALRRGRKKT